MSSSGDTTPSKGRESRPGAERAVLDPSWEEALVAGQEAEGESGSVEDELAILHLLRHAAAPEVLGAVARDRVWSEVDAGIEAERPAPWWKLGWIRWVSVAAVSAAALTLVIVAWPDEGAPTRPDPKAIASAEGTSALLQAQFDMLEPRARREVQTRVEQGRASMRAELLARAVQTGRTMGGAP